MMAEGSRWIYYGSGILKWVSPGSAVYRIQGRGCIKDSQERQVEEGEAPQTWALGEELQFLGS